MKLHPRSWQRPSPWILFSCLAVIVVLGTVGGVELADREQIRQSKLPVPAAAPTEPVSPAVEALFRFHATMPAKERANFVGSAACARCHAAEATQQQSRHARTLARVDPKRHRPLFAMPGEMFVPEEEAQYRTFARGSRCTMGASNGAEHQEAAADYVFGSGRTAFTYVSRQSGASLELRLSYYPRVRRWDYTPGLHVTAHLNDPLGLMLDPKSEAACFGCHATALVSGPQGLEPEHSLLGIGCESCHGPGREHVAAVRRRDPDLHIARLEEARGRVSLELCGRCHRGRAPGGMTEEMLASQQPRMQGYALSLSACYRKGGVTCTTCHDPHRDLDEKNSVHYNAVCSSCHAPGQRAQTACPVQPRGDCISCHMPEQDVMMPTSPRFRTHWIKVWREAPAREAAR